jgi:hypothetical protein
LQAAPTISIKMKQLWGVFVGVTPTKGERNHPKKHHQQHK